MFSYKIVVLGDFGVGKTSLVRRFVENSFDEEYLSSIGVTMSRKECIYKGIKSTMIIWDTEGRTEHSPIFKQYLLGAKAFIIVADLTRKETIEAIKEHTLLCQEMVCNASIYIALNKSDLEHTPVEHQSLRDLSSQIVSVYETSAKSGDEVEEIFAHINTSVVESSNAKV